MTTQPNRYRQLEALYAPAAYEELQRQFAALDHDQRRLLIVALQLVEGGHVEMASMLAQLYEIDSSDSFAPQGDVGDKSA